MLSRPTWARFRNLASDLRMTAPSRTSAVWRWSRRPRAAVVGSEVDLLREDQGIIHLDPETSNRALQLRMTEQELARP